MARPRVAKSIRILVKIRYILRLPYFMRDVILSGPVSWAIFPDALRWRYYRRLGLDVGEFDMTSGVYVGSRRVSIGDGCRISRGCTFEGVAPIHLGQNVWLGHGVSFVTSSHLIGPVSRRAGQFQGGEIRVGDGTWIGHGVTVLAGVSIGRGVVIGAGAVVSKDCVDNGLYLGVPARLVRLLDEAGDPASVGSS